MSPSRSQPPFPKQQSKIGLWVKTTYSLGLHNKQKGMQKEERGIFFKLWTKNNREELRTSVAILTVTPVKGEQNPQ